MTYVQHERMITSTSTITKPAHHLRQQQQKQDDTTSTTTTLLSKSSIQKAVSILQTNGFVVLNSILSESKIKEWKHVMLQDFDLATDRLLQTRDIDLLHRSLSSLSSSSGEEERKEALSYREMAMREDFRVDLRDGPNIRVLRKQENDAEYKLLGLLEKRSTTKDDEEKSNKYEGPIVTSTDGIISAPKENDTITTAATAAPSSNSLRFHPSILSITKSLFNPHGVMTSNNNNDSSFSTAGGVSKNENGIPLYKGNFGRYNFDGPGPTQGLPQPIRVGQIGSVISLPGAADQALHADTAHLFEHLDCLPCHYANLFFPGVVMEDDNGGGNNNDTVRSCCTYDEDGNWTGNVNAGGTAFVYGSHSLGIAARLTVDDDEDNEQYAEGEKTGGVRKKNAMDEMHLRTIRPSLRLGDAVIFDCRVLHFGLANKKEQEHDGKGEGGIRRPMLYVNMTHSWFHDPKNWDDRETIFE
eukprot:14197476-Ditylum_brightwellii.AAC.1